MFLLDLVQVVVYLVRVELGGKAVKIKGQFCQVAGIV